MKTLRSMGDVTTGVSRWFKPDAAPNLGRQPDPPAADRTDVRGWWALRPRLNRRTDVRGHLACRGMAVRSLLILSVRTKLVFVICRGRGLFHPSAVEMGATRLTVRAVELMRLPGVG